MSSLNENLKEELAHIFSLTLAEKVEINKIGSEQAVFFIKEFLIKLENEDSESVLKYIKSI